MAENRTLRSIDIPLLAEGGAEFNITIYPVRLKANSNDVWWQCIFSIHTTRVPNAENDQVELRTARNKIWRMRDLNKLRGRIERIFKGSKKINLIVRPLEE